MSDKTAEQAQPVEYQYRMRPDWEPRWQDWARCSKEVYEDYARLPLHNEWHYEVRALCVAPVPHAQVASERDLFEAAAREEWAGKSIPDAAWIGWQLRAALAAPASGPDQAGGRT